jgi:phosphoheptose isomerase
MVSLKQAEIHRGDLALCEKSFSINDIAYICERVVAARDRNAVIYTAGNGGSALNAAHLACHLRDVDIRAVCLMDNPALLTSRSNDIDYPRALRRTSCNY